MKILHTVESYTPVICGMQEVVRQISEPLERAGHDVTVATSTHPDRSDPVINGVHIVSFPISGNAVRGYQGPVRQYQEFLLESDFDVITNFAAQQWATDLVLPLLPQIRAKKVFVPTGFSALYYPSYRDYFEGMKTWLHLYDMNVFLSNTYRDIDFARACRVKNLIVIPNGAEEKEFLEEVPIDIRGRLGIPPGWLLILHVGSHTGAKGHSEAIKIFQRARLRQAAFVIVGRKGICASSCHRSAAWFRRHPRRFLDRKCLILADLSRQETIAAYQQADLFLFPSNVECSPIVLFECMASRTPFLATDVGNATEVIAWSGSGVCLPTEMARIRNSRAVIRESARLLEELSRDSERRRSMAESGFRIWKERFTWERIAAEYERLYQAIVDGIPTGGGSRTETRHCQKNILRKRHLDQWPR